jgi:hypothetical protein
VVATGAMVLVVSAHTLALLVCRVIADRMINRGGDMSFDVLEVISLLTLGLIAGVGVCGWMERRSRR